MKNKLKEFLDDYNELVKKHGIYVHAICACDCDDGRECIAEDIYLELISVGGEYIATIHPSRQRRLEDDFKFNLFDDEVPLYEA